MYIYIHIYIYFIYIYIYMHIHLSVDLSMYLGLYGLGPLGFWKELGADLGKGSMCLHSRYLGLKVPI